MPGKRITLDDVAQFDSRVQLAVLAATSRVYASGLEASGSTSRDMRHDDARRAVEDYLDQVAPLIVGSTDPD